MENESSVIDPIVVARLLTEEARALRDQARRLKAERRASRQARLFLDQLASTSVQPMAGDPDRIRS